MSITNRYLDERALKLRAKAIPWEGYQRAGLLEAEEVALITALAGSKDTVDHVFAADGPKYAALFLRLINKLSRNDTIQFIVNTITEIITDHEDRIPLFLHGEVSIYPALLKLLDSSDDFLRLTSLALLSTLVSADPAQAAVVESVIPRLVGSLNVAIRNAEDKEGQDIAVQCAEAILRGDKVRAYVWHTECSGKEGGLIDALVALAKSPAGIEQQMQYQLVFCFWLFSFDQAIGAGITTKFQLIPLLAELAKNALKEKVIRLVVAALRNLATQTPALLPVMLAHKLQPLVASLAGRKWSDEEIFEDLQWLLVELNKEGEGLTTFDLYSTEITSGALSWGSPTHTSEEFWRENAAKLNEKGAVVLKALVNLLQTSDDDTVLAVAANDLAQFILYFDGGKKAVEGLAARGRIMELMSHPNSEVKFQALVCVQRLVAQPWA